MAEDAVPLPRIAEENSPSVGYRRTISDNPPTGYTAEGVPIFHSLPDATSLIYLNFLGGKLVNRSYYSGAGGGSPTSWGPIMGAAYYRAVSKFNNGDYPGANNHEDDVAIISRSLPLRTDEVGNTLGTAKKFTNIEGFFGFSTFIEWYTDVDIFYMDIAGGPVSVFAKPYTSSADTLGNNLDIALQLLDASGNILVTSDPTDSSSAGRKRLHRNPFVATLIATATNTTTLNY